MTRASHLRRTYGITEEQYDSVLKGQGGNCGVCGRPAKSFKTRLCVDHDHHTGAIRGLLCTYCNRRIIGRHRTPDGEQLLARAAKYLEGPYTGWFVPPKKKRKKRVSRRK